MYNVAIYCRVSRDDGTDVSGSIESQKETLIEYVKSNNWKIYDIYIDDGYTGTNFNRPSFSKLVNDIEIKKVNLVITKDLSRLGRNYLQTGYYTEEFFPNNDVRYIALNDNFDTKQDNDFAPFKNIINEWYAKDISKKIRFSMTQRQKQPKVIGSGIPLYGYIINDKKERIINYETSCNVVRIFNDYINGISSKKISENFYNEKIITPGYYLYLTTGYKPTKYSKMIETDEKYKWDRRVISRIIRCIEYTGDLINKKYENKSFKNKSKITIKSEDRFHFEDIFEPIISKDIYYKANKIMDTQLTSTIDINVKMFSGIVLCSCCGSELKYINKDTNTNKRIVYMCRNKSCNNRQTIKSDFLIAVMTNEVKVLKETLNACKNDLIEFASLYKPTVQKDNNINIEGILKQQNNIELKIEKLVDAKINDQIPTSTYDSLLSRYMQEKDSIEKTIKELLPRKKVNKIDYKFDTDEFISNINTLQNNLNRDFITSIIDKIIVNKKENIFTIVYKGSINEVLKEFNNV